MFFIVFGYLIDTNLFTPSHCIQINRPDSTKEVDLAPVVQRLDNVIHRINHYPVDNVVCFVNTYPLDSDLSGG